MRDHANKRQIRRTAPAGLFAAIGAGVATNFDTYINTHFWEFTPKQVSWIVLSLFLSAALAAMVSTRVTQRFDKKATALASKRSRSSGAPHRSCCDCSSGFRPIIRRGCFRSWWCTPSSR